MTEQVRVAFQTVVWRYYTANGRHDLPWRQLETDGRLDPYKAFVSELMLQQTQVPRVMPKFKSFVRQFPTFEVLAAAPLADVLKAWSGLGYNRRAKFLWQAAAVVVQQHHGALPNTRTDLMLLPGVGANTAGALLAYAFDQPAVFVETNIRTVFIHHFLPDAQQISDTEIANLVAQSLPDNPRQWYWALMDYGTHLKQTVGNLNKLSKHYTKQSVFNGSGRQIRGAVLRVLGSGEQTTAELTTVIPDERLPAVLDDLASEQLITKTGDGYNLAGA